MYIAEFCEHTCGAMYGVSSGFVYILSCPFRAFCRLFSVSLHNFFNPLALGLDIYSLAHHLCKM